MNKKKIFETILIVVMFSASGLVLYFGLFKKQSVPIPTAGSLNLAQQASTKASTSTPTVTLNQQLDFDALNKYHFQYNFSFPQLNPGSEVGVPTDQLFKLSADAPAQSR